MCFHWRRASIGSVLPPSIFSHRRSANTVDLLLPSTCLHRRSAYTVDLLLPSISMRTWRQPVFGHSRDRRTPMRTTGDNTISRLPSPHACQVFPTTRLYCSSLPRHLPRPSGRYKFKDPKLYGDCKKENTKFQCYSF